MECYQNMNYGYIDKSGSLKIEPQYYEANNFHSGLACVAIKDESSIIKES